MIRCRKIRSPEKKRKAYTYVRDCCVPCYSSTFPRYFTQGRVYHINCRVQYFDEDLEIMEPVLSVQVQLDSGEWVWCSSVEIRELETIFTKIEMKRLNEYVTVMQFFGAEEGKKYRLLVFVGRRGVYRSINFNITMRRSGEEKRFWRKS